MRQYIFDVEMGNVRVVVQKENDMVLRPSTRLQRIGGVLSSSDDGFVENKDHGIVEAGGFS